MKPKPFFFAVMAAILVLFCQRSYAQSVQKDSSVSTNKNVIRYNFTGALLFGFDKYIVLGYERVLSPKRSFSVNIGSAALPKLISVVTDSFETKKQGGRKGYNVSIDYRFYLAKENKFAAPHGVYIGPYYSYNHFENEQLWERIKPSGGNNITTNSDLNIHTFGFELGYQFILGKHFALDLVMVGPGIGFYNYKASFAGNTSLSAENKEQLYDALEQILEQKIPGMNYVFNDKKIDADGTLKTRDVGYRFIVHIGYAF